MTDYPYYSPPPRPPPKCNHTIPSLPPPPPPPKCNHTIPPPPPPLKCNHTIPPPPPPPPKCNHTKPPPPPPCPCVCPPIQPPAPTPYYWPTPPPIAPQPPPGPNDHTVIIAVFVSLGGVFFLAFLAVGLFCLAKKKKKTIIPPPAAAAACVEEHQHIQETITTGPCGEQTVTVTIDDDVRIHEVAEVGAAVPVGSHVEHHKNRSHAEGHLKNG